MSELLDLSDAIKARLETKLPVLTSPPTPATAPDRFWIFYPGLGLPYSGTLTGEPAELRWDMMLVCAAGSVDGLLALVDSARSLLLGFQPLSSRACGKLIETSASLPVTDGPEGHERVSTTLEYHLTSTRALGVGAGS